MIPKRLFRITLAGAMTAALLAMPLSTLAATPAGWDVDPPTPLPDTVSAGNNAGWQIAFHNDGPSTISQLYFFTVGGPYEPVYAKSSQGTCSSSGQLMCTLGQVKKGDSVTIVVAFHVPVDTLETYQVQGVFNTSGLGSGGGDNSHGDELPVTLETNVGDGGGDFAGSFVVTAGTPVANSGPFNGQGTTVYSPAAGIAVTVEDGPGVQTVPCPDGYTCVGETSEIHVGDGSTKYGLFHFVIQIDKQQFSDVNSPNLGVIHVFDDGETYEQLPGCPTGPPSISCANVSGGRMITISGWLAQNGFIKYH